MSDPRVHSLLLAAALSLSATVRADPPASPAPVAKPEPRDDEVVLAAAPLLKKMTKVRWALNQVVVGDVVLHRHKDLVALGVEGEDAIVAVLPGPITAVTVPILVRMPKPKAGEDPKAKTNPNALCGDAGDLKVGLEPPGVRPADLNCAQAVMTPACHKILAAEMTLQQSRNHGGRGIVIAGGTCLPLHLYFADGKFQSWRNE